MYSGERSVPLGALVLTNLYLKQGICLLYVMVDFIYMGLLDLLGDQTENYKMKNSCQYWDSKPGPFAFEANSVSVALLFEISIENLNVDRVLPHFAFIKLLLPGDRCNKIMCRVFLTYNT